MKDRFEGPVPIKTEKGKCSDILHIRKKGLFEFRRKTITNTHQVTKATIQYQLLSPAGHKIPEAGKLSNQALTISCSRVGRRSSKPQLPCWSVRINN